ncbi:MAG: hypothetical protein HY843_06075, partial [Bdellovibrio sp.]|nr:hypothetical protein [Bdellovibrio sp.]
MKNGFFKYVFVISFIFVTCFSMGCSKSSSAVSSLKAALASVVVTSPTASSSTSLAFSRYKWLNYMFPFSVAETTTAPPDVKPMDTMKTEFNSALDGGDPTAMAGKIGTMNATTYRAPCYGPVLTDNATGVNVNRPLGDLGMWASTGSPSSAESCAAAELAALIGGAPQFVNKLRNLQATLIIAMGKNGRALPDVGVEVDGLSDLPTISGMTISSAKLKR